MALNKSQETFSNASFRKGEYVKYIRSKVQTSKEPRKVLHQQLIIRLRGLLTPQVETPWVNLKIGSEIVPKMQH